MVYELPGAQEIFYKGIFWSLRNDNDRQVDISTRQMTIQVVARRQLSSSPLSLRVETGHTLHPLLNAGTPPWLLVSPCLLGIILLASVSFSATDPFRPCGIQSWLWTLTCVLVSTPFSAAMGNPSFGCSQTPHYILGLHQAIMWVSLLLPDLQSSLG